MEPALEALAHLRLGTPVAPRQRPAAVHKDTTLAAKLLQQMGSHSAISVSGPNQMDQAALAFVTLLQYGEWSLRVWVYGVLWLEHQGQAVPSMHG